RGPGHDVEIQRDPADDQPDPPRPELRPGLRAADCARIARSDGGVDEFWLWRAERRPGDEAVYLSDCLIRREFARARRIGKCVLTDFADPTTICPTSRNGTPHLLCFAHFD